MTAPAVSVVMSVYNGQRYLGEAVESVLAQTLADFEFLINDDGSSDDTWQILAHYAARDSRITLYRNLASIGVARSVNKLFALARGAYLTRHDADDISAPQRLAEQVAFLQTHPEVGLVGAQVDIIDAQGGRLDGTHFFYPATSSDDIQEQLLVDNCLCQGSVLFRRRWLESVGDYDASLEPAEDYDLWLRLAGVTRLARLESHLYQYRYHPESLSETRNPRQLLNKAIALDRAVERRFSMAPAAARRLPVARQYLRAAVSHYASGDLQSSHRSLARALTLGPELFGPLDTYLPVPPTDAGLAFAEAVLADLPHTRTHARLAAQLRSRLHMRRVFEGAEQGDCARIDAHLWPGIRNDPRWLLNRGVLSLLMTTVFRRAGHMMKRRSNAPQRTPPKLE